MFCKTHDCTAVVVDIESTSEPNIYYHSHYFDERGNKILTYGVAYEWYYVTTAVPKLEGRTMCSFDVNNFALYKMYWFFICLLLLPKVLIIILIFDKRT